MKSSIQTVDALISEPKVFPKRDRGLDVRSGISMQALGFTHVKHKDVPQRAISKIINPNTLFSE
jgi:hypothetical protein